MSDTKISLKSYIHSAEKKEKKFSLGCWEMACFQCQTGINALLVYLFPLFSVFGLLSYFVCLMFKEIPHSSTLSLIKTARGSVSLTV